MNDIAGYYCLSAGSVTKAEAPAAVGARALLVDSIDQAARLFYLEFGFIESPILAVQLLVRLSVAQLSEAAAQAGRLAGGVTHRSSAC